MTSMEATPADSQRHPSAEVTATGFGPTHLADGALPDLDIVSSDAVRFHVHSHRVLRASGNSLAGLISPPFESISVTERADVLNLVLHIMYGRSCSKYQPSLETIARALGALVKYSAPVAEFAASPLPLYILLLAHAPIRPIETYALAGHHDLEEVAVAVSPHLLGYPLSNLSDELAVQMGPVYLKRLMDLHQTRLAALKAIVLTPPSKHGSIPSCDDTAQGRLIGAWAFAAAQLVWDARPGISAHALQSAFEKAYAGVVCEHCQARLQVRIQQVGYEWCAVKRTI